MGELAEMVRRLVLVGLMVLMQGSIMQIYMGILLSTIFLFFQVQASPYKDKSDNFLASAASFCLVILFVCAYAFKTHALLALPDIKAMMSPALESYYVLNQSRL